MREPGCDDDIDGGPRTTIGVVACPACGIDVEVAYRDRYDVAACACGTEFPFDCEEGEMIAMTTLGEVMVKLKREEDERRGRRRKQYEDALGR